MDSSRQTFSIYGPPPIASFDWNDLYHRASLVASLVQGVYTLQQDNKKKRQGSKALANPWWESSSFTLTRRLNDPEDGSIYGAVFKNNNNYQNTANSKVPPRYLIAFRGTILKRDTGVSDVTLDIQIALENLDRGARPMDAIQVVKEFVANHGNAAVWIAGHSLGAAVALHVGREMAKSGSPVEAYIFNPPISSIPIEKLAGTKMVRFGVRIIRDFVKASIVTVIGLDEMQDEVYRNLASWRPHLFVNQSDLFGSEYIGYFTHKMKMIDLGLGGVERRASYSIRNRLFGGRESSSSTSSHKHLHFLPSALVTVNSIISTGFRTDHGIEQWWNPILHRVSYKMDM